jgi:hypothetical protein
LFLDGLVAGQYVVADLSAGTLRRGVEIDPRFADLDLDFVDGAVMAIAERLRLPILTFDFEHFHGTRPPPRSAGSWSTKLVAWWRPDSLFRRRARRASTIRYAVAAVCSKPACAINLRPGIPFVAESAGCSGCSARAARASSSHQRRRTGWPC